MEVIYYSTSHPFGRLVCDSFLESYKKVW